jgi:chemotaxis protein methyltransferase CheR
MVPSNKGNQIDAASFDRLRTIIHANCGIALNDEKATLVSSRLFKRLRDLNLETYSDYIDHLQADRSGEEMTLLLDAISTNVTYFFREPEHFTFLQQTFDKWLAEGRKKFRIWCAASSTGEEPYSLMMALEDRLRPDIDFKMIATDISTRALAQAIRGTYPEKVVDKIAADLRKRFMQKVAGAEAPEYVIADQLKKRIMYRRLNLIDLPVPFRGPLDLILCRNTMIYFDQSLRQKLVAEFERLLRPGGYLIVSHSESLVGLKTVFKTEKPSIYRKLPNH